MKVKKEGDKHYDIDRSKIQSIDIYNPRGYNLAQL